MQGGMKLASAQTGGLSPLSGRPSDTCAQPRADYLHASDDTSTGRNAIVADELVTLGLECSMLQQMACISYWANMASTFGSALFLARGCRTVADLGSVIGSSSRA